jgi:acyl-CoA thioesterase I
VPVVRREHRAHAIFPRLEGLRGRSALELFRLRELFRQRSCLSSDFDFLIWASGHGQPLINLFNKADSLRAAVLVSAACLMFSGAPAKANQLDAKLCETARPAAYALAMPLPMRAQTVVAIGSSSTEGVAKNDKSKLYPAALEAAIKRLAPTSDIRVINKGRGGETMKDMLARFEQDVIALKPSLVIWQLGVNDVLRFSGTEGRRQELQAGLKLLADNNIPVVLLDLQYAPMVVSDPDTVSMQSIIGEETRKGVNGRVQQFRRFAMMKSLADDSHVPIAEMIDADGLHMTDAMHACVGRLLADMISPKLLSAEAR